MVDASSDEFESDSTSDDASGSGSDVDPRPSKSVKLDSSTNSVSWYMHRRSRMLHLLVGQSERPLLERVLNCGRALSDTCTKVGGEQQGLARCAMCAKSFQRTCETSAWSGP